MSASRRREQDPKEAAQDARLVKQKTLKQQRSVVWRELKREESEKKQTEREVEQAQLRWLRSEEQRLRNLKEKKNTNLGKIM